MTEGQFQSIEAEIRRAISDCDDDETAALTDVVMPIVARELAAKDAELKAWREECDKVGG